jgi:hypothetical protein
MSISTKTGWLAITVLLAIGGCNKSANPSNNSGSNPASPGGANSGAADTSAANSSSASAPEAKPERPAPQPIVIPAGRVLVVSVDQSVSSKTANAGDHFNASLARPVVIDGKEVVPAGTKVSGVVTDAKSAGRFKGHAELGLGLDSITINGQDYPLQTSSVAESSKGRGKRTAVGAGGGAAFGAIVGAIAGGGKGAAIGALAGGGAGSAGAAFTGKRDIVIPAETRLDFKLAQPLTIPPSESR